MTPLKSIVSLGDTLDKERAADLIATLNEAAAQHGFLLGIEVEQSGPNELTSIRLRFIQTTSRTLPVTDEESARQQAWVELQRERPVAILETAEDRLERLSAAVHADWMTEQVARGRTSSVGREGEEHMVPYAQLSEAAKELDRVTVRAVLKHLPTPES